jgi:hypothetical protein
MTKELPTTTRYLGFAIFPVWNDDRTDVEVWDVHHPDDLVWKGRNFSVNGDPVASVGSKEEACKIIREEVRELKWTRALQSGNINFTIK